VDQYFSILKSLPAFVFKVMIMNLNDFYYKIRSPLSMGLLFTEPHLFHATDHCGDSNAMKLRSYFLTNHNMTF